IKTDPSYGIRINWSPAELSTPMSYEEARFWIEAFGCDYSERSPSEVARTLTQLDFREEITLTRCLHCLGLATDPLDSELLMVIAHLRPATEILDFLMQRGSDAHERMRLMPGVRPYLVPRLTPEQVSAARGEIGRQLGQVSWPTSTHYCYPDVAYYLAAAFGFHEQVRDTVESWPADEFHTGNRQRTAHPLGILFGLDDPNAVVEHVRRLGLKLESPWHVAAWLAHTELGELGMVDEAIRSIIHRAYQQPMIRILARVDAPEVAPILLDYVLDSTAPEIARRALVDHAESTILGLAPLLGRSSRRAETAREILRGFARQGRGDVFARCLDRLAPAVAERLRREVIEHADAVALDDANAPEWFTAAAAELGPARKRRSLRWPEVTDLPAIPLGPARLGDDHVRDLLHALRQSTFEAPAGLVVALREHAGDDALDAFAWQLFELWLAKGAASRDKWAMTAVGLLGGDVSALKLAPLVEHEWPRKSLRQRAAYGLECLRAIGSDSALMQIHGIVRNTKYQGIRQKARETLAKEAQARGMRTVELEDHLVPDCGLDAEGRAVFDFGPRRFELALGPDLKPQVRDEVGKLRASLPKPGKKDDAELAAAARERWNVLKKLLRQVLKIQVPRLEQAMVTGRRWSRDDFEALLLGQPLMRHLVPRLLWGTYDGNVLRAAFRVTTEGDLAGQDDDVFVLGADRRIGIPHPLELDREWKDAWRAVWDDYEILPPFAQLDRPVHRLEEGHAGDLAIERFAGIRLRALSLIGVLEGRGWIRGEFDQNRACFSHAKPFPSADVTAITLYDVGIDLEFWRDENERGIERCVFVRGQTEVVPAWDRPEWEELEARVLRLGEVPLIVYSEVTADLEEAASKGQ
ncbi:MAG: DUF4132 domain-containing protein, partial [bacterium]|nr:DUF4132 domain-containing protein [bacterium]